MKLNTLRLGDFGELVELWENYLYGEGVHPDEVNGHFDEGTYEGTKLYQKYYGLTPDGVVGPNTWAHAKKNGIGIPLDEYSNDWPPKPGNLTQYTEQEKDIIYGKIEYVANPIPGNKENIKITNNWVAENITKVHIPQLMKIEGAPRSGNIFFHRKASEDLRKLFQAWDDAGLMPLVKTWSGAWAPRFIRGSRSKLSNHSHSIAFDINYFWNRLGRKPSLKGETGSVRELIPIANELGWYWGGHWKSRPDGMHFECGKIIS